MRALIVVGLLLVARVAAAEPDNKDLVLVGLAMAPPTYLIGVTLHEGSHALAAEMMGADVTEVRLFPPGIDPKVHKFRWGWTYVQGLRTRNEKIFFYLAPKITDSILLGGFAALILTNTWPDNRYAQLALTVGATGLWVDFSKDVVLFSKHNDVVKAFNGWCMTGWKQLPARLVYGVLVVASGYTVARGYQKTFGERETVMTVPLLTGSF
ncbi:MAG TPA: M50 family metallopeptidase [Kofleriaceae bacterium]